MIKQIMQADSNIKVKVSLIDDEGYEVSESVPIIMWALYEDDSISPLILNRDNQLIDITRRKNFKGYVYR